MKNKILGFKIDKVWIDECGSIDWERDMGGIKQVDKKIAVLAESINMFRDFLDLVYYDERHKYVFVNEANKIMGTELASYITLGNPAYIYDYDYIHNHVIARVR